MEISSISDIKFHIGNAFVLGCEKSSVLIAWCNGMVADIVRVDNKDDYDNCTNLGPNNLAPAPGVDVEGIIAAPNTKAAVGTHFFASIAYCQYGFKIQLKITDC